MNKIWCVLVLAGSIGVSGDLVAGGRGHHFGGWGNRHHFGGGGYGHRFGYSGRSRVGIGFYFGPNFGYGYSPYYGNGYYPYYGGGYYPYYGNPYNPYTIYPPAVVNTSPPVYIEREADSPSSGKSKGYWYYCSDPSGYYPYIKECHDEWQPVPAEPPSNP